MQFTLDSINRCVKGSGVFFFCLNEHVMHKVNHKRWKEMSIIYYCVCCSNSQQLLYKICTNCFCDVKFEVDVLQLGFVLIEETAFFL